MNGAYAATAIALIAALAKRGMISGSVSKVNPHTNRVRVNFNLNRSTFSKSVPDKDKYFQYSLYGNTTNIGDIQIQSQSKINEPNEKGSVLGWAELVCLKDVSVYCDVSHMKKFHEALEHCKREAKKHNLSFHGTNNEAYFEFMDKCIKSYKRIVRGKQESVTKTPFCFFEGEPLSLDQFKKDLILDGFDFNAPSGLAKFNPRNPTGQPPIFTFADIDPNMKKGKPVDISKNPAIVGAKYVCMFNTIATKFAPVYVWGPTVCPQSFVWDKSTTGLCEWEGRQKRSDGSGYTSKINTYNLYINKLKKGSALSSGYRYISKTAKLPDNYMMMQVVHQRDNKGKPLKYKGPPRPFIPNKRYLRK